MTTQASSPALPNDAPPDEFEAQMEAIEQRRRAAIISLSSGIVTFLVLAFVGEFTLASPLELGTFELTKGHVYLIAPFISMLVAGLVFVRVRPKTASFLSDGSVIAVDPTAPRDLQAEEEAGLASGRKALQAKLAAGASFVLAALIGRVGLGAYYEHLNTLPRDPYEYVPLARIGGGEIMGIGLVALVLALVVHHVLAPKRATAAAETGGAPMDGETKALYGEVRRNTRQARVATLAGGAAGAVSAGCAFYALVGVLEPASAFDLRLLFGTMLAAVLVGGSVRRALLPESMREEGALDVAALPAGSPDALTKELGESYSLRRKSSLADLVGLGSHAPTHYDVLSGGALAGFVREVGNGAGALLLGGERSFTWAVSDAESRVLQVKKAAFASELTIVSGSGEALGRIRRSRLPFVRTLVIEHSGESLRLSRRWFGKAYDVRAGAKTVAEVRAFETRDDVGMTVRQVDVTLVAPDATLLVLAGALAMDAL